MPETAFTHRPAVTALLALILCGVQMNGDAAASCISSTGKADVDACEQELKSDPRNRKVRIALTQAMIKLGQHKEAVSILRAGLEIDPEDQQMKNMLKLEESFLEEQNWSKKQRALRASGGTGKVDTKTKLNIIRCTKLKGESALIACDKGLETRPDDPDLLMGKGDVLFGMNRITEAILLYRSARELRPSNRELAKRLRRAESKRNTLSGQCLKLKNRAEALEACNTALLKGAADESRIQKRRGDLLAADNKKTEAMKAYKEARRLTPSDQEITRKIASLEGRKTPGTTRKTKTKTAAKAESTSKVRGVYSNAPLKPGITY